MKIRVVILLFVSMVFLEMGVAQEGGHGIRITAKATKTSIKLRWAPTSPIVWHYANQYGYTLERIVFLENGKVAKNRKAKVISEVPFKPKPLSEWENVIEQDDYAAVAGQSIYGESFDVTESFSSGMVRAINEARELENRFSFALYAADLSIKAAEWSGLYFEDEEVHNGYTYLYKIYANIPKDVMPTDTSTVLVSLDDYHELPSINNVYAEFKNKVVEVRWSALFQDYYSAYWVEKSEDGEHFTKITETPLVFPSKKNSPGNSVLYKFDSLEQNNKTYYYRVLGVDPFGDISPPSETTSGSGIPDFQFAPSIEKVLDSKTARAKVNWSFPEEGLSLLKYFSLHREDPTTKQRKLVQKNISGDLRSVEDSLPHSTNYYVISAHDIYGRSVDSFPFLFQLDDSIPPTSPTGLAGKIDTLGRVWLSWNSNTEPDLYGYKLYRSNFQNGGFVEVPGPIIANTQYVDTLFLKTLTEEVYYQAIALDKRFNSSSPSSPIKLKKPDLLPPAAPVFRQVESDSAGIVVGWEKSSSQDAVRHFLYRRSEKDIEWTLVRTVEGGELDYYRDEDVKHQVQYAYTLIAIDDDGLESVPASPVTIRWMSKEPHPKITQIFKTLDKAGRKLHLSWEYPQEQVEKFLVYKSSNGAPMTLFESISSEVHEIVDSYSMEDDFSEYQICAVFKNGEHSSFSRKIKFEFQGD